MSVINKVSLKPFTQGYRKTCTRKYLIGSVGRCFLNKLSSIDEKSSKYTVKFATVDSRFDIAQSPGIQVAATARL